MAPFSKSHQLVSDSTFRTATASTSHLPDYPTMSLSDACQMRQFLHSELCCEDLEKMSPLLWIMTTFSSANINPLHKQRVKGREIIVTEDPRLHLVWIHNRIFIKPLPSYLLSVEFWDSYIKENPGRSKSEEDVYGAAMGFLRTYRYLIQHASDFRIAQQDHLSLVPKDIKWEDFSRFTADLEKIDDKAVSGRYHYGELRLTRLNFYAPFLIRKFHFEQVHGQYGDFFGRLFAPLLFIFALISIILNAMQVVLASGELVVVNWESFRQTSRWFSVFILVCATIVSMWFAFLWLWIFLDEWIFTVKHKIRKGRQARLASRC